MIVGVAPALVSKWVLRDWSAPLAWPRRRPAYRENAAPVAPFLQFAECPVWPRTTLDLGAASDPGGPLARPASKRHRLPVGQLGNAAAAAAIPARRSGSRPGGRATVSVPPACLFEGQPFARFALDVSGGASDDLRHREPHRKHSIHERNYLRRRRRRQPLLARIRKAWTPGSIMTRASSWGKRSHQCIGELAGAFFGAGRPACYPFATRPVFGVAAYADNHDEMGIICIFRVRDVVNPKSGHWLSVSRCPLCAKSRHSALQQNALLASD